MERQVYRSRLLESQPRVEDVVSFRFERPAGYEYQAGQWFVLTFPAPSQDGGEAVPEPATPFTHHFSHSSSPLDPWVELTTRLRGSKFKNALAALPLGAEVEMEGPFGSFVLPPDPGRLAFLTGGIGITCLRSIMRWLGQSSSAEPPAAPSASESRDEARGAPSEMVVVLQNRSEESIVFRDELEQLADRLPFLRLVHVLSRPTPAWRGRRGHLDQPLLDTELSAADDWIYYLSGPPSLVQTTQDLLRDRGVDRFSIHAERFEGYE